ncbi:MAG: peptidoglycan DD-metalloendopeptidase family protein [Lachnospiraceae bacterium]|nr:peptidoglycan DD-metalloendopeptidase family protein [Lachnospiraceae bacterium]
MRIRCAVLGTLFFVSSIMAAAVPAMNVRADEATEQRIKEREAQVAEQKKERESIQANISDLNRIKSDLEHQKEDLNNYVTQLDANLTLIQGNIEKLRNDIALKEEEIEVTTQELAEAQAVQDAQYEAMKQRVRFMYEKGDRITLEVLFGNGTFGENLNKAHYIEKLSEYDRNMLDEYIQQKELIALTKEALEEEQRTLEETKEALEEEEQNLEKLITEKMAEILGLNADISSKQDLIRAYENSLAQRDAEISALERAISEDKARLAAENMRRYDGGMFTWPCPSTTVITSDYGNRVHPIFGGTRFHSGIDIGGAYGAAIVAAYAGTVVAASYNASMGNYVMIDHGDNLYTIYMHCSSFSVSTGANVNAGDRIASVGATGNATGPHLHFSVRLNGAYVSPWNYLG